MRERIKRLLKKKWFWVLAPIILIVIFVLATRKAPAPEYTLAKVTRATLKQTVSQTGTVEAPEDLNLSFLMSGRLSKIHVHEGERAVRGQVLAELDYGALKIKEKEARASLASANANLDKLVAGATGSEIKVARANVNQAQSVYDGAVKDLDKLNKSTAENNRQAEKKLSDLTSRTSADVTTYEQSVTQAQTTLANAKATYKAALDTAKTNVLSDSDDGILSGQTALDKINTVLTDNDAIPMLSIKDIKYLDKTKEGYNSSNASKIVASAALAKAKSGQDSNEIKKATDSILDYLNTTLSALDNCFKVLGQSVTSTDFTQTDLDAYKTAIAAQITAVTASISSLQTAEQSLDTAILNYDSKVKEAEESLAQSQAALDNAVLTAQNTLDSTRLTGDQQLSAAESKVDSSKKSLDAAQASLDKVLAGSNNFDVRAAQAALAQAQANLESVQRQIEDSIIKAPVSGVVTKISYEIGEAVAANTPAVSMIGDRAFNIKVDVSEIDVAKIKVGNECEVTFDAFGPDRKVQGRVYYIDTAPTIIQDVVYYQVKVRLDEAYENQAATSSVEMENLPEADLNDVGEGLADSGLKNASSSIALTGEAGQPEVNETASSTVKENYDQIKPGMTANIDIFAARKDNVLIMPQRGIIDKGSEGKFANLMSGKTPKEVPIEIGLKGDDGMVEVVSGVKEGDDVVTFIKEAGK